MNQIKDMGQRGAFGKGMGKVLKNDKVVTSCELSFFNKIKKEKKKKPNI